MDSTQNPTTDPQRLALPIKPVSESLKQSAGTCSAGTSTLAGIDSVRAAAAVGVVALHAGAPYLKNPMPGLAWSIRDQSSSVVDFAFWSIELVIMPVFLVIAGFFAWQSLSRSTPVAMVKTRSKRLLIPLAFAMVVVLPLDLYAWVLGWVAEGWVEPVKLRSLKFDGVIDQNLWGLSHLWFLQYLFLYILVLAVGKHVANRRRERTRSHSISHLGQGPAARPSLFWTLSVGWFVVAAVVVWLRPHVVWGFQHAFFPVPSKWLYHGLFFAAGVGLAIGDPKMLRLSAVAPRLVIPCLMLGVATVSLGQWHLGRWQQAQNETLAAVDGQASVTSNLFAEPMLAVMTPFAALAITLAMIGVSVAKIRQVPVAIEYLAAASFWVYLVHHPILGLVHVDLKWFAGDAISPALKAFAACVVSLTVSLLTFEALVRKTQFGRMLGMNYSLRTSEQPAGANTAIGAGNIDVISIEFGQTGAGSAARHSTPTDDRGDQHQPRRAA
ncbi:acyltransferase family protein [Rubripirellula reticaptiva]|uniref:Glucans biosynthesis protein n=1 Tax=Rubripirellula reticaptiva TaxID=2528013 RepID=A0A5C6EQL1_9BACT|nr:acyltransferase [Rubripirellula reticaptiva]TWU51342.1 glucans biosynthesis protein [Rubripirellula reticaptiva]